MTLTPRQIRILLIGTSAGAAGRGFVSEDEELAAWNEHREVLLQQLGGADRPAAYFKFELSEDTPAWILQAECLFRDGLFTAESAASMEQISIMAPDQPAELHQEFSTPEKILDLGRPLPDLEKILREFGHAQAWHAYRGRPELAAKYDRIGAALRKVLRENLTMLKPKEGT